MPLIRRGSCVGVYFRRGNEIRVHNGRLLRARYGNTWFNYVDTARLPDVVEIAHYNVDRSLGIMFLERLPIRRIVQVNRTPDLNPSDPNFCARFRGLPPRPDRIRPGNCIGMRFTRANGQMDVKNGKFLYWLDNNNRRHCVLREGQSVPRIVYMHMNVQRDQQGNILGLTPEIRSRTGILEVRRATLLPNPT